MRVWEHLGNLDAALASAKAAGDEWNSGRIEQQIYDLPENPFISYERAAAEAVQAIERERFSQDNDFRLFEDILELKDTIRFLGFDGKVVADIGARDGRFEGLIRKLGASDIYGIDPDSEALAQAVSEGKLDSSRAINCTLQGLPDDIADKIDAAVIFNFLINRDEWRPFLEKLHNILPKNGQALISVVEDETLELIRSQILGLFRMRYEKRMQTDKSAPHKYLATLTKF